MNKLKLNYTYLVILHALIGLIVFFEESLSKAYFLAVIVYFFYKIITVKKSKKSAAVLVACSYIASCEVFFRMTGGNFSYEGSKYMVIIFLVLGIAFNSISRKSYPYLIYILLLAPGIVVASFTLDYTTVFRKAIAFNLSGPVCLGIAALYCYKRQITTSVIDNITKALALPVIGNMVYLFLYNPSIKDVLSGTQSNFAASGGFGPNQVATVLGLGMFAIVVRYILFSKNIYEKVLNLILLGLISFRAIITFSRGGVITSVVVILAFLIIYFITTKGEERRKLSVSIGVVFTSAAIIWIISSIQTLGFIDKRYANQDAAGRVKQDITTGRIELVTSEFQEFFDSPFIGVGVGKVKEARFQRIGVNAASHNEMSRILAEHGMFGIAAFSILLFVPLLIRSRERSNYLFYSFYLFWFLTINHSSMRIAAPAFIYALCLLDIKYDKPSIHRKQIS